MVLLTCRNLTSAASNIRDKNQNKVQVLVSGNSNIISSIYRLITNNDIRGKKQDSKPTYHITQLEEYDGPNIDWNGYQLSFISEQKYKGFHEANVHLISIEKNLKSRNSKKQ